MKEYKSHGEQALKSGDYDLLFSLPYVLLFRKFEGRLFVACLHLRSQTEGWRPMEACRERSGGRSNG